MSRVSAQIHPQRHSLQTVATSLTISDAHGRIVWVNSDFIKATGYSLQDLIGKTCIEVLHGPETDPAVTAQIQDCIARQVRFEGELLQYGKSGVASPVTLIVDPISNGQGMVTHFVCQRTDVTVVRRQEQERQEQIGRQRNVLVREVHHRIKNSLQGVVGLLRQHVLEQPQAGPALEKAIAQVRTVAVVHGLEGQAIYNEVVLCEMVPSIAGMVEDLIQPGCTIGVQVHVPERICVDEQERVPLALVINELILNAAKHSCTLTQPPRVTVMVVWETEEQAARISVCNSGVLPDAFDFAKRHGIGTGLELVGSMLPPQGADLSFHSSRNQVEARLVLFPPAIYGLRKN